MTIEETFGSYEGWCEAHQKYINTVMIDRHRNTYLLEGFTRDERDFYWLCRDKDRKKIQVSAVIWLLPLNQELPKEEYEVIRKFWQLKFNDIIVN